MHQVHNIIYYKEKNDNPSKYVFPRFNKYPNIILKQNDKQPQQIDRFFGIIYSIQYIILKVYYCKSIQS